MDKWPMGIYWSKNTSRAMDFQHVLKEVFERNNQTETVPDVKRKTCNGFCSFLLMWKCDVDAT